MSTAKHNKRYPIGQRAYLAYCVACGGQTFDGRALPTWEQLGDEQRAGWAAAERTSHVKSIWSSWTLWTNLIAFLIAVLGAAQAALPALQGLLPLWLYGALAFALPVINTGLRFKTNSAIVGGGNA